MTPMMTRDRPTAVALKTAALAAIAVALVVCGCGGGKKEGGGASDPAQAKITSVDNTPQDTMSQTEEASEVSMLEDTEPHIRHNVCLLCREVIALSTAVSKI